MSDLKLEFVKHQTILIYGPPKTGKSIFVKRLNAIEKSHIPKNEKLELFPVVYVVNDEPEDIREFDIVLRFDEKGATFEKGIY